MGFPTNFRRDSPRSPTRRNAGRLLPYAIVIIVAITVVVCRLHAPMVSTSFESAVSSSMPDTFRQRNLAAVQSRTRQVTCRAPIINWAEVDSFQQGSTAGILADDLHDPAVSMVIQALHSRSYTVQLFIEDGMQRDVHSFLHRNGFLESVRVQLVQARHYMINSSIVHMFVYMPMDESTIVAGRGKINWLLMPEGKEFAPPATLTSQNKQSSRHLFTHKIATALRGSQKLGVRMQHWLHREESESEASATDLALSTYDYLVYRSTPDLTRHLKVLTPALERLQDANKLFPLVDVLTFPQGTASADDKKMFQAKFDQMAHRSGLNKVFRFFLEKTIAAYKARLTPEAQALRDTTAQLDHNNARFAAVIVEARPHFAFLYTVLNAAWYLPGWTINVVHSRMNAGFVKRLLKPHLNVRYHQLETDNMSIDDYNNLMKNLTFWQSIEADNILLFQTDSLILRSGAEEFAKFDYIGAPWHLDNERWSQPALKAALPDGVGNGGFSIRSLRAMESICRQFSQASPLKEQEDVFFATHIQQDKHLKLADRLSAYQFCLEVPCRDLPLEIPLALHAAWYYNDLPTMIRMLDSSLAGLMDCA